MENPEVGIPVDEIDLSTQAHVPEWVPRWLVDAGGVDVGITIDDHCFVVLAMTEHGWRPTSWFPWQVARRLGELADGVTP